MQARRAQWQPPLDNDPDDLRPIYITTERLEGSIRAARVDRQSAADELELLRGSQPPHAHRGSQPPHASATSPAEHAAESSVPGLADDNILADFFGGWGSHIMGGYGRPLPIWAGQRVARLREGWGRGNLEQLTGAQVEELASCMQDIMEDLGALAMHEIEEDDGLVDHADPARYWPTAQGTPITRLTIEAYIAEGLGRVERLQQKPGKSGEQ